MDLEVDKTNFGCFNLIKSNGKEAQIQRFLENNKGNNYKNGC